MPVNITVRYFAILKEERGQASEQIRTDATDLASLFAELSIKHHFSLDKEHLRVAVNDSFANWHDPVSEGTQIVFIPPVAGG